MNNHQHQISSLQEIHNHSQFDDDFLQMLSSASPWADNQITHGAATPMMLHLLSRTHDAAFSLPQGDHNDVVHVPSFNPHAIQECDASIKAIFNGFTGSLGQTPSQPQQLHHSQTENAGVSAAVSPPSTAGQPRQRVRARRGQATDPHSIAERLRRERIAERMKALQELVPNANRTDKASMLDEIIDYVKFLQIQVKVLSTSRLGGVAPLLGETSSQGKKDDGDAESERAVAKLMEEDMGSAMQYLQGKGLCLMPISLATST